MSELRFETEFKGYDKEEVEAYIHRIEDEHAVAIRRLEEEIKERDRRIIELANKQKEVEEQYKGYAEHYDKIGRLVYESQVKAEETMKSAHEEEEKILRAADEEAKRRVDAVEGDVEQALADGRIRYRDIQTQINDVVESLNTAQQRFMAAFREVHGILDAMPDTLDEALESDMRGGDTLEMPDFNTEITFDGIDELDEEGFDGEPTLPEPVQESFVDGADGDAPAKETSAVDAWVNSAQE